MPRGFKRRRNTTFGRRTRFKRRRFVRAKRRIDKVQNARIRRLALLTRPEYKFIDQYQVTTVPANFTNLLPRPLTYMSQGSTNSTRIGNKVKIHSVRIRGSVVVDDSTNIVRMMLVRFGRTEISSIAVNNVLEESSSFPQALYSNYKRNGDQKYQVLYDKQILLTGGQITPGVTTTSLKKFDFTVKPKGKNRNTFFTLDSDTSPAEGYMYLIAASDSQLSGPEVTVQSRVIFSG